MLVQDHMTPRPITLRIDTDFKSALQLMQKHFIHHLPVLGTEEQLVGIVAERDLMLAALRYLGSAVEVERVMHRKVVTARPDMPVADAATLMVANAIGGLPVVDASGRVVGVITESDIFKAFLRAESTVRPASGKRATTTPGAGKHKTSGKSVAVKKPASARKPVAAKKPAAPRPAVARARAAKPALRPKAR
jgi:CBS domain-containing protein